MSDEIILKGLIKRDQEAWNMLVNKYSKRIYNIALNFAGNADDASDITQDVFLKIYNNINKFKEDRNLSSWVLKLTKNHCIDCWRKNRKNRLRRELDENTCSEDDTPEETAIKQGEIQSLRKKLECLEPEARLMIIMRDIQDQSYQEIADHLNIPLGTAKSRINRARLKLAKVLMERGKNGM